MFTNRTLSLIGAGVVGALALAGCGSPAASAGTASASRPTLVVYSAQGYDSTTVAAFQHATGIPTTLVDDSTGPLITRIEAERNNPKWGLLWVDGDEAFAALDRQGLLLHGVTPAATLTAAGKSVVPADHSYVPTGLTGAGAVIYNPAKVSTPPATWTDLLSSRYRGLVGMNDPAVSGPTYPFVAGQMQQSGGISAGKTFFTALKANGLHVFQTNGDTVHALETGQIGIGIIQSSAAIGATLKHPQLKVVFPSKITLLPSCIGIDAHAPAAVQAEAKKFAAFVLSPAGQRAMQTGDPHGDSLYWPVVSGVAPLPAVPAATSIPLQTVNPYTWGARENALNAWFTAHIVS